MESWRALVAVAVVVAAVGGAGGLASATASEAGQEERELLDADAITVTVEVHDDGTAEWSIQYKYRLDTPNRTRGFERLRGHVQASEASYASDVRDDVTQTVAVAENDTERAMSVGNVSVDAQRQTIPQDFGVVVHRFTWHGFAATDGDVLRAGDAIRGFWLRQRTELRFEWPTGYRAETIDPEPDESDADGATWDNPDFGVEEPSMVLRPESSSDWSDLVAPGLVLLTVVGGLAVVRRRGALPTVDVGIPNPVHHSDAHATGETRTGVGAGTGGPAAPTDAASVVQNPAADRGGDLSVEREAKTDRGSATENSAHVDSAIAHSPGEADSLPEEAPPGEDTPGEADAPAEADSLGEEAGSTDTNAPSEPSPPLSNEEQLLRILECNDGRARQQTIAEGCDWSASKTSRVVRSLEEEDVVDVFRIGRENVVSSTEDDLEDV